MPLPLPPLPGPASEYRYSMRLLDVTTSGPVTAIYFGLCWLFLGMSLVLVAVGLWNAELALSEKGFYGIAFALSLFAAIAVQKNVRDVALLADEGPDTVVPNEPRRPA